MERTRVKLSVLVDLDPIPGAMHSVDSAKNIVQTILLGAFPHYNPVVCLDEEDTSKSYRDQAIYISMELISPGGMFFMNDDALVGDYCIRSDDPQKRDLFLPAYIFRKCFRWASKDHDEWPCQFSFVEEIA